MPDVQKSFKIIRTLGLKQTGNFIRYQLGLRSGYFKFRTPQGGVRLSDQLSFHPLPLPSEEEMIATLGNCKADLLAEADEICAGYIRLFGGQKTKLILNPNHASQHWSISGTGEMDPKLIWEPARFGWAIILARAFFITKEQKYQECFWNYLAMFQSANPINVGPNWESGQEVAIRCIALTFVLSVLENHAIEPFEKFQALSAYIAQHAERILPTLSYAKAQNNNHLLTEAAGLYTAGVVFRESGQAKKWKKIGWQWLHRGLQTQIQPDGTYIQQSTNYHRLMLQTALWTFSLSGMNGDIFPKASLDVLKAASGWYLERLDEYSGQLPNLGHNDGSLILPMAVGTFLDARPVIQASSLAFLNQKSLPSGPWDEFSLWLGLSNLGQTSEKNPTNKPYKIGSAENWASMRIEHFNARPAHADQLHVEMWWQGYNIALDAGTYSYNAAFPWENALAQTSVHNTIVVDHQDQMLRAGKFIWLDWAQAKTLSDTSGEIQRISASHDGYQKIGVIHKRSLIQISKFHWLVEDELLPSGNPVREHEFALHWLLPDWPWQVSHNGLILDGDPEKVMLKIRMPDLVADVFSISKYFQLIQGGKLIYGNGEFTPNLGWYSPTYALKIPALSFRVCWKAEIPCKIQTEWLLGKGTLEEIKSL